MSVCLSADLLRSVAWAPLLDQVQVMVRVNSAGQVMVGDIPAGQLMVGAVLAFTWASDRPFHITQFAVFIQTHPSPNSGGLDLNSPF